jgi:type IV secretion system protein VirD4
VCAMTARATPVATSSLTNGLRRRFAFGTMTTTKINWGQISLVLAIVLITTWAATQWVAWRLGFQPQLGEPWFELGHGWPVYPPLVFFRWWLVFDAYAPNIFNEGGCIAASGGGMSIVVAFVMSIWRAREAKTAVTHGSARWASGSEIRALHLTQPDGVVLGRLKRNYLRHNGDPVRQGRRPCCADAFDLAGELHCS